MIDYPPGEGPITEEDAKASVEADEAAQDDDEEPPAEPLTGEIEIQPDTPATPEVPE